MTTNTFKFIDMVASEALAIAHEQSSLLATVDRQYDEYFGKAGGKIGDTLRVRSPNQYKIRSGNAMDVQAQNEVTQNVTMSTLKGVDMDFSRVDLLLKTDDPKQVAAFSKRYIEPAMSTLISNIEYEAMAYYTKRTYNLAGTAGSAINSLTTPNLARAKLNQNLAPKGKDGRAIQMDSMTMASLVGGAAAYFNPQKDISEQYREGLVARTSMADYYENERVWTMTNSGDVGGEINFGTLTSGITSLTVDGFTVAPNEGQVFTVEGVYDIHPETKAAYSHLKQFVVTAGATSTNLTFSPAMIYSTTDPRQNCAGIPIDGADITFVGAVGASYVQPLMYHKEAFQFVTADLPTFPNTTMSQKSLDGLSLCVWMDADIRNNNLLCRIDILYGFAALRPEWACRMAGVAN
jgi:hypothetical protein